MSKDDSPTMTCQEFAENVLAFLTSDMLDRRDWAMLEADARLFAESPVCPSTSKLWQALRLIAQGNQSWEEMQRIANEALAEAADGLSSE